MGVKFKPKPTKGTLVITPAAQKALHKGKPKTVAETLAMLEAIYWKEVARAKTVARLLAGLHGTVTSREVVAYMIAEGTFTPGPDTAEHWISAVWREKSHGLKVWEDTGEWRFGKSTKTQGGKRSGKVWRLRKLPWTT